MPRVLPEFWHYVLGFFAQMRTGSIHNLKFHYIRDRPHLCGSMSNEHLLSDRFKKRGQFANPRLVRCVHSPHSGNFVLGAKTLLDHDLSRIVSLFIRETPIDFIDKRLPTEQKAEIIFPVAVLDGNL